MNQNLVNHIIELGHTEEAARWLASDPRFARGYVLGTVVEWYDGHASRHMLTAIQYSGSLYGRLERYFINKTIQDRMVQNHSVSFGPHSYILEI